MTADRALRLAAIAIVVGLGVVGIALPGAILVGGCAWLAFVCCALSGWGWLLVRALRLDDVDFGLRAVWGIAAVLAVAGVLVMLGVCSRPAVLALLAIGAIGFAWREWLTTEPLWQHVRMGGRVLRERPIAGYCALIIGAAAVLFIVGAVCKLERNPWDDDIAYTPLQQRLLQAGNLIEPFSFRRLASYGGQTVLQALGGARGSLASVHAIDRGLCFSLVLLLLVGHARARRVSGFWLGLVVLVLLLLPDISINTASYWSGAACFYALYRTVALARSPRQLVAAALVAAAICTLRMNYLAVVVPYLALVLAFRARRTGWRAELRTWRLAIAVAAGVLIPWCIAAFASSRTFLFPIVPGTWNHGLSLQPTAWSWVDQLAFLMWSCIQSEPIVVMPLLFILLAFTRDEGDGRPLASLFVACTIGFLLLAHSFETADTYSIWRYGFGYVLALVLAFVIEVADDEGSVKIVPLARWILVAALLVQLAFARTGVAKTVTDIFKDIHDAGRASPEAHIEEPRYAAMQAAVPAGARLATMVDDAVYLDFRRNEIVNLDTPGWASPMPQMPSFSGPEAMRAYFLDQGIRYIAFVRSERSKYFFRRGFWVWRLFNDAEVFQAMSAYVIDTIDALTKLSSASKVLYDHDGLVVLDIDAPHGAPPALDPAAEAERREAFVHSIADSEHLLGEWSLTSRHDLLFMDGMTGVTYPDTEADPHWFDVVARDPAPTHGVPIRWMHRRVHFRVRGDRDMHLQMRGHVNLNAIYSRPRLVISLDGDVVASTVIDEHGGFQVDAVVPRAQLDGWCDLYATFDSIGQADRDIYDLKVARLESVAWEPL